MTAHALAGIAAALHVEAVAGFVSTFRLIVEEMHAEQAKAEPVQCGTVALWVQRLDFIGNALGAANDTAIEALRGAGVETVLCDGSVVSRAEPPNAQDRAQAPARARPSVRP